MDSELRSGLALSYQVEGADGTRRSSLFNHLLWAHLKPFPLAFIPALCNQVVGGLPVQWRLAGYSHSPSLLSGPPTRLHFPVFFAEELSGQICDN